MTREEAIRRVKAWNLDSDDMEVLATIIPELRESEDENLKNKSGYYKDGKFWKASTLWNATRNKVPQRVPNRYILQECTWNIGTLQRFADEVKNVQEVSLDYPIILDMNGNIIDGAHRVVKAYLEGKDIDIVYIGDDEWPEPDYDEEKAVRGNNDERIKKSLIKFLTDIKEISESGRTSWAVRKEDAEMCKSFLDYLGKQKVQNEITIEQVYKEFINPEKLKDAKTNKYIRAQLLWELMHNGIITAVDYQYLTDDKRKPWTEEEYLKAYRKGFDMSEQLKQKEQKPVEWSEEDERIRKALIWHLKADVDFVSNGVTKAECIAYLEKQKEQKDYRKLYEDIAKSEWFKKAYAGKSLGEKDDKKEQKPVERSLEDDHIIGFVYDLLNEIEWKDNWAMSKEECLRLLSNYSPQKITRVTINGEPISTENKSVDIPLAEWSEEDEAAYNAFICEVVNEKMNPTIEQVKWLRGICDRLKSFYPQSKQEWNDEDKSMLNTIITDVGFMQRKCGIGTDEWNVRSKAIQWLKNLLKRFNPPKQEWKEVELEFRGEKVKVKRPFFCNDKGREYSTTEQDEDVAWYALRAWCNKKGISLYDLYPKAEWSDEDESSLKELIHYFESLLDCLATEKRHVENRKWLKFLKSLRPQYH